MPAADDSAVAAGATPAATSTAGEDSPAVAGIKAALDMFRVLDAPPTTDVPSKQALVQAAEQAKTDAAKIGIMCSGSLPPADQAAALASALQSSAVSFAVGCHALTGTAGPTLKASLAKTAQGVLNPCLALLQEMGSGKDLMRHVAVVWDGVAAVSKAPLDNKACLFAALANLLAVLKDTLRELEELEEEQQERFGDASSQPGATDEQPANGKASSSSSDDDDDDGADLDYEAEQMSSSERAVLGAARPLLAAAAATLSAYGKALLQGPQLHAVETQALLEGWESCLWHGQHLRRAAEDLGAAMYPPQDHEEVAGAARAVFDVAEMMQDECPDAEAVGAEQLSTLSRQLNDAHDSVQQLLEQAAAAASCSLSPGQEAAEVADA